MSGTFEGRFYIHPEGWDATRGKREREHQELVATIDRAVRAWCRSHDIGDDERTGRQVDGTTRLYFGLSQFLREWRPARISDFPERATKSRRRR